MRAITLLIAAALAFPAFAMAQEVPGVSAETAPTRANSINVNPFGVIFGSYSLNYEHLINGHHGLLVEGLFSQSGDDDSSSLRGGGGLGYRYHFSGQQQSVFLGFNVAYQVGSADTQVMINDKENRFDIETTSLSATANVGKRWAWDGGFNITARIGAGYARHNASTDSDDPGAQKAVELVDGLLSFIPVALDGELSVGWVF